MIDIVIYKCKFCGVEQECHRFADCYICYSCTKRAVVLLWKAEKNFKENHENKGERANDRN